MKLVRIRVGLEYNLEPGTYVSSPAGGYALIETIEISVESYNGSLSHRAMRIRPYALKMMQRGSGSELLTPMDYPMPTKIDTNRISVTFDVPINTADNLSVGEYDQMIVTMKTPERLIPYNHGVPDPLLHPLLSVDGSAIITNGIIEVSLIEEGKILDETKVTSRFVVFCWQYLEANGLDTFVWTPIISHMVDCFSGVKPLNSLPHNAV